MLGTTKIYGCIADPIDHVKAPTIFTSIFKSKNIDAVMIPLKVSSNDLTNLIQTLKKIDNFHGLTVTIPHKSAVVELCDLLDTDAETTQAVNWIKFDKNRKLIGNNFDGKGFINGFLSQNHQLSNKIIGLFGSGGAAVAIGCSLAYEGIKELKIKLPEAKAPVGSYVATKISGKLLYVSGQISINSNGELIKGKVGKDLTTDDAYKAAERCGLSIVAQVKNACNGDLSKVKSCIKLTGFVNSTEDFTEQPKVINGASDLIASIFGEAGMHTRAAVSANSLPLGVSVEVDAIFELN